MNDNNKPLELHIANDNDFPRGPHWDEDGACYVAKKCDPATFGCTWRWSAMNKQALEKGYHGQELFPFLLPREANGSKD